MSSLPVEILEHICGFVYSSSQAKQAQKTFTSLAVVSKALNYVATPWLYRRCVMDSRRGRDRWQRTMLSQVTPFSLCKKDFRRKQPQLKVLGFRSRYRLVPGVDPADADLYESLAADPVWPDFKLLSAVGAFDHLVSLSFMHEGAPPDAVAFLLSPASFLRRSLHEFRLGWQPAKAFGRVDEALYFVLLALDFFPPALYSKIELPPTDYPLTYRTVTAEDEESWAMHLPLESSPSELRFKPTPDYLIKRAQNDWSTFCNIWQEPNGFPVDQARVFLQPASIAPFSRLTKLHLPLFEEEQLYLVFCTGTFPALVQLSIRGALHARSPDLPLTLRCSVSQRDTLLPGKLTPPVPLNYLANPTEWPLGTWDPLDPDELRDYPFKPYRGPKLEVLNLGELTVHSAEVWM